MKRPFRKNLPLLSAGALLSSLLTACSRSVPPLTSPTFNLSFSYPAQADLGTGLALAAYTYSYGIKLTQEHRESRGSVSENGLQHSFL